MASTRLTVSTTSEPSSASSPLRGRWSSTVPPVTGLSTNRCTSVNFASRTIVAALKMSRFTTSGTGAVGGAATAK